MKWEDHKDGIRFQQENFTNRELTDVECPKCGKYIFRRTDFVYTSNPPQYLYECVCGWRGFACR
jgi:predicted RNA-binding Zn-ribbon protein involved in translation (DUF1610 family)